MDWITGRRYAWPILVALVIFAILNAAASPAFTDSVNWNGMLIGAAPFIITAMAQTAVVMSGDGGVDLSVGPLAGLVNALIASVLVPHGWTDPFSIVGATLLVGVASGLLNGIMVAVVRVQPIIATLGTYLAYQGTTLEMMPMAGGQAPDWLVSLANSRGGVPGVERGRRARAARANGRANRVNRPRVASDESHGPLICRAGCGERPARQFAE
jgi:ribose transport system permease protein